MTTWAVAPTAPSPDLVAAVEEVIGHRAVSWRKPHTGITPAQRFVVAFDDGSSAFVKAPVDAQTSEWSAREQHVLRHLDADFAPKVLHASDTLLITEDLSNGYWPADHPDADGPVTWQPGQVEALLATLGRVATSAPDVALPGLAEGKELLWPRLAADSGLPRRWCDAFVAAERDLDFRGDALVHNDVRSDNVCFVGDRPVLVDWTNACRGDARFDRVELALTYAIEGGPDPWELVPDAGLFPVWQAGLLSTRARRFAGHAPGWLIAVFSRCAAIAIAWSARLLNLSD